MSINWVMLQNSNYVLLPSEKSLFASPPRISLSLRSPHSYPGSHPVNLSCPAGQIHLTNQRLIYLPERPTELLQSFSAPLTNLYDSHVSAPWFGANVWSAVLKTVPMGGLDGSSLGAAGGPSPVPVGGHAVHSGLLELKLTFKEGGAFDFHSTYERIRERMREVGSIHEGIGGPSPPLPPAGGQGPGAAGQAPVVDLDELPAYEPTEGAGLVPVPGVVGAAGAMAGRSLGGDTRARPEKSGWQGSARDGDGDETAGFEESAGERAVRERRTRRRPEGEGFGHGGRDGGVQPPQGPPPGYEEATKPGDGSLI